MGFGVGTEHHNARLNPELVQQIRAWREDGMTIRAICEALDWRVNTATAWAAITRRTWRHVQ